VTSRTGLYVINLALPLVCDRLPDLYERPRTRERSLRMRTTWIEQAKDGEHTVAEKLIKHASSIRTVQNVRVQSGLSMLAQAAIEAVKQWRYCKSDLSASRYKNLGFETVVREKGDDEHLATELTVATTAHRHWSAYRFRARVV